MNTAGFRSKSYYLLVMYPRTSYITFSSLTYLVSKSSDRRGGLTASLRVLNKIMLTRQLACKY